MSLLLDAGALIAVERGNRSALALIRRERVLNSPAITHAGVVAQVWRGGAGKQAQLARLLRGVDVRPLDDSLGRLAGVLLGTSKTKDVVDAALICLARDGDEIATSDPEDLARLARAADLHVDLVSV